MENTSVTISTRVPKKYKEKAEHYVRTRGYANLSDLLRDSLREKIEKQ